MATIKATEPAEMKTKLINLLSLDDVEIQDYMIKPDIQRIDMSDKENSWYGYKYTGTAEIIITIYKLRGDFEE